MQASSQLYTDAIDILADQDEGKEGLSGDLFRQTIGKLQRCCSRACDVPEVGMDLSLVSRKSHSLSSARTHAPT